MCLLLLDLMAGHLPTYDPDGVLVTRWNAAADAARANGVPVIFVRVAFRAGYPDVSDENRVFAAVRDAGRLSESDAATAIHPAVAQDAKDIVVTKRRISAFAGSDLDVLLRSLRVDALVLAGLSTSGVVLATLIEAADRDYGLTVLGDACADPDTELHHALVERFFPQRAVVTTTASWIDRIAGTQTT
jgi:nicotinamidase-related amidase